MPTYTIVNDPDGTFRVHKKSCADIERRINKRLGRGLSHYKPGAEGAHDVTASDVDAAVAQDLYELDGSYGGKSGYDESYWVVLPCTKEAQ
jgi:hypothetical protein